MMKLSVLKAGEKKMKRMREEKKIRILSGISILNV